MGELTVETMGDRVLGSIFIMLRVTFFVLATVDCSFSFASFATPYMGFTPEAGLPRYRGMFLLKILAGLDGICLLVPSAADAVCV